jgi:hypothetical protein
MTGTVCYRCPAITLRDAFDDAPVGTDRHYVEAILRDSILCGTDFPVYWLSEEDYEEKCKLRPEGDDA